MSKFITFVQWCRLHKNIKTCNFTKDEFPHIYFLGTLPRLLEHRFQEELSMEKNVKWEVFYINSCPAKSCSTVLVVKNLENYLLRTLFLAKLLVLTLQFLTTKNTILRHTNTQTKYCFTFLMFKHPAKIMFSKCVRTQ